MKKKAGKKRGKQKTKKTKKRSEPSGTSKELLELTSKVIEDYISEQFIIEDGGLSFRDPEYDNYDLWGWQDDSDVIGPRVTLHLSKRTAVSGGITEIIKTYEEKYKETHILRYTHKEGEVLLELIPMSYKHLTNPSGEEVRARTLSEILGLYRDTLGLYRDLEKKYEEHESRLKSIEEELRSLKQRLDEFVTKDYLDRRLEEFEKSIDQQLEEFRKNLTESIKETLKSFIQPKPVPGPEPTPEPTPPEPLEHLLEKYKMPDGFWNHPEKYEDELVKVSERAFSDTWYRKVDGEELINYAREIGMDPREYIPLIQAQKLLFDWDDTKFTEEEWEIWLKYCDLLDELVESVYDWRTSKIGELTLEWLRRKWRSEAYKK